MWYVYGTVNTHHTTPRPYKMGISCFGRRSNTSAALEEHALATLRIPDPIPKNPRRRSRLPALKKPSESQGSARSEPAEPQPAWTSEAQRLAQRRQEFYLEEKARILERAERAKEEAKRRLEEETAEKARLERLRRERSEYGVEDRRKWTWGADSRISAADLMRLRSVGGDAVREKLEKQGRDWRVGEDVVDVGEVEGDGGYYAPPHRSP